MHDWRDEKMGSIVHAYGEPAFYFHGSPVWTTKYGKGFILDSNADGDEYGNELRIFTVDEEFKIFDVWYEGHFVDYGEDFYNAWQNYEINQILIEA